MYVAYLGPGAVGAIRIPLPRWGGQAPPLHPPRRCS